MPTPGKLELTIKINEFPALVRTLESGWKQFDIDTGDQIVTISVKPKIFKKLEQAQENYPQWVAALAGQMGEKMESGFVLRGCMKSINSYASRLSMSRIIAA